MDIRFEFDIYSLGTELVICVPGNRMISAQFYMCHGMDDSFLYKVGDGKLYFYLVKNKYILENDYPFYERKILLEKITNNKFSKEAQNVLRMSLDFIFNISKSKKYYNKIRIKPKESWLSRINFIKRYLIYIGVLRD